MQTHVFVRPSVSPVAIPAIITITTDDTITKWHFRCESLGVHSSPFHRLFLNASVGGGVICPTTVFSSPSSPSVLDSVTASVLEGRSWNPVIYGMITPWGCGPRLLRGFFDGMRSITGAGAMMLLSSLMTGICPTETSDARDPARVWILVECAMVLDGGKTTVINEEGYEVNAQSSSLKFGYQTSTIVLIPSIKNERMQKRKSKSKTQ